MAKTNELAPKDKELKPKKVQTRTKKTNATPVKENQEKEVAVFNEGATPACKEFITAINSKFASLNPEDVLKLHRGLKKSFNDTFDENQKRTSEDWEDSIVLYTNEILPLLDEHLFTERSLFNKKEDFINKYHFVTITMKSETPSVKVDKIVIWCIENFFMENQLFQNEDEMNSIPESVQESEAKPLSELANKKQDTEMKVGKQKVQSENQAEPTQETQETPSKGLNIVEEILRVDNEEVVIPESKPEPQISETPLNVFEGMENSVKEAVSGLLDATPEEKQAPLDLTAGGNVPFSQPPVESPQPEVVFANVVNPTTVVPTTPQVAQAPIADAPRKLLSQGEHFIGLGRVNTNQADIDKVNEAKALFAKLADPLLIAEQNIHQKDGTYKDFHAYAKQTLKMASMAYTDFLTYQNK